MYNDIEADKSLTIKQASNKQLMQILDRLRLEREVQDLIRSIKQNANPQDFSEPTGQEGIDLNTPIQDLYQKYEESDVNDVLAHYGILGMKWGVRRERGSNGLVTRFKERRAKNKATKEEKFREKQNKMFKETDDKVAKLPAKEKKAFEEFLKPLVGSREQIDDDVLYDQLFNEFVEVRKKIKSTVRSVANISNSRIRDLNKVKDTGVVKNGVVKFTPQEVEKLINDIKTGRDKTTGDLEKKLKSRYGMTHSEEFEDYLAHYGILGMKWGVRRERGPDGLVVKRSRAEKKVSKAKAKRDKKFSKKLSDMDDQEIRSRINRLQMEKQYRELSKSAPVSEGEKFAKQVLKGAAATTATAFIAAGMKSGAETVAAIMKAGGPSKFALDEVAKGF